ncbi:hypothetical protein [Campylobacter sp.]|uniref:hypothetical protein n=1 Tax=Campylobacter sp. TaxID=205 RepID=UPI0025C4DBFE|nr:hypothetical protein [Campylobacter sp.]
MVKRRLAARGYGLSHACAASEYCARLAASGKISSTTDHGRQIKFCIKTELFRNSSAFEIRSDRMKGKTVDGSTVK